MLLVAIARLYVVLMMAAAEAASPGGTLLGAFFTLLLYGVLPMGICALPAGHPGATGAAARARGRRAQGPAHGLRGGGSTPGRPCVP